MSRGLGDVYKRQILNDSIATYRLLELFRSETPPIALAPELKIEPGRNPRDPMRVTGRLLALTLRTS